MKIMDEIKPPVLEEANFMADMVEVRMKLYSCRLCGIRYENMDSMKQHYQDEHTNAASMDEDDEDEEKIMVKEEIEDETAEEISGGFVLVNDDGEQIQLAEGIQLGENQVIQVANTTEDGQIVLQIIQQDQIDQNTSINDHLSEDHLTDPPPLEQQVVPRRRGRKRKSDIIPKQEPLQETQISVRPKRTVIPNIKSEFVYEDGNIIHVQKQIKTKISKTDDEEEDEGQVVEANDDSNDLTSISARYDQEEMDEDEDPDYPNEYTPTSKIKKGRAHEPKSDDSHLRKFPCPFQGCKYVAKYRSNLWDHKKTHTGEKPYACNWPSCSMRFSQTHQLKLHLRSHTGERPYVCDWPGCNSAFSQKPGLKSHMLTHTGEKPFKCDFPGCGWTFRLKGALTDHKRAIHEDAKKHICEWPGCNKRFLQQCHLKKHIMGHADIKPFACDWPNCNYKAVTMAYVTNHRKTHTGEKNYECTFTGCNKRFVKSSHVNRHRQRCHPELFMMMSGDDEEMVMMHELEDGEIYEDNGSNQCYSQEID